MGTLLKLGFGVVKSGAKGIAFFLSGGKGTPEFRIDLGEKSGPNTETHYHLKDERGQSIAGEALELAFNVAYSIPNSGYRIEKHIEQNNEYMLQQQTYILGDINSIQGLKPISDLEKELI